MIKVTAEHINPKTGKNEIAILEVEKIPGSTYTPDRRGQKFAPDPRSDYVARWVTRQPNGDISLQRWTSHDVPHVYNVWGFICEVISKIEEETCAPLGEHYEPNDTFSKLPEIGSNGEGRSADL